jgi:hypothetical protein
VKSASKAAAASKKNRFSPDAWLCGAAFLAPDPYLELYTGEGTPDNRLGERPN